MLDWLEKVFGKREELQMFPMLALEIGRLHYMLTAMSSGLAK